MFDCYIQATYRPLLVKFVVCVIIEMYKTTESINNRLL